MYSHLCLTLVVILAICEAQKGPKCLRVVRNECKKAIELSEWPCSRKHRGFLPTPCNDLLKNGDNENRTLDCPCTNQTSYEDLSYSGCLFCSFNSSMTVAVANVTVSFACEPKGCENQQFRIDKDTLDCQVDD